MKSSQYLIWFCIAHNHNGHEGWSVLDKEKFRFDIKDEYGE